MFDDVFNNKVVLMVLLRQRMGVWSGVYLWQWASGETPKKMGVVVS